MDLIFSKEFKKMVATERDNQDKQWGVQDHTRSRWMLILANEFAKLSVAVSKYKPGYSAELLKHLIHVAAVCQVMYESGRRNGWIE